MGIEIAVHYTDVAAGCIVGVGCNHHHTAAADCIAVAVVDYIAVVGYIVDYNHHHIAAVVVHIDFVAAHIVVARIDFAAAAHIVVVHIVAAAHNLVVAVHILVVVDMANIEHNAGLK